jgi:alpha-L-fucosidase
MRHIGCNASIVIFFAACCSLVSCLGTPPAKQALSQPAAAVPAYQVKTDGLEGQQRKFLEERFGMFIHFGILTYTGTWSQANLDIKKFNPDQLDCGQWADAAKAAGMTYGVLTTKHHDGFALWPTATSDFCVKSIPWRGGKGDVVREYVDAFRARGLKPGLYYSVWDNTQGLGNSPITRKDIDYVEAQLRELLSNYGPIPILVLDGYSWRMGHSAIPWSELREFIRGLQPDCLVIDHTHLQAPWQSDLGVFEEPRGVFAPAGNTMAAAQDYKIIDGNDWFWGDNSAASSPLSADNIVNGHLIPLEQRYTTFILNCPPNRHGLMDPRIVATLAEVGKRWKPNLKRPPLPAQGPQITHYLPIVAAEASTGNPYASFDGKNDSYYYSVWISDPGFPQSITLDLGAPAEAVDAFSYVPQYETVERPTSEGAITHCKLYSSLDGQTWAPLAEAYWPATPALKTLGFAPTTFRYVKVEVLSANGRFAAATEFSLGRE